jgi:hypothetical protein
VTVQVEGMGTAAGPPARGRTLWSRAGRALARAAKESRLKVVECSMFKV